MTESTQMAGLKEVVGALLLAAKHPLTVVDIRKQLLEVGDEEEGKASSLSDATTENVANAIEDLTNDLKTATLGIHVAKVAEGYKLQTNENCGPWVRHLLELDTPQRLSRPALETLAIIAYRQPATRADIEAVRGVGVDHIMTVLLEMQMVRIVGRSNQPGRPMLYGTTKQFLEHFGLAGLEQLPAVAELGRIKVQQNEAPKPAEAKEDSTAESTDDTDPQGGPDNEQSTSQDTEAPKQD